LSDIDLKAGSISIRRLKGSLQTVQPLYPHRGQPLLDEMNALRAWLREQDGSDYLFTSQKGGRLDRTQFFRIFRAWVLQMGNGRGPWDRRDGLAYPVDLVTSRRVASVT
jgi:integrase